jgi:uncharacterized protein YqeY
VTSQQDDGRAIRARLNQALRDAMRSRDQVATSALRSALAAIANAEAVAASAQPAAASGSEHFAGAAAGLGATEVARKELTEPAVRAIVRAEIADRDTAVRQYARGGHADRADRLRAEINVLEGVLTVGG